MGAPLKLRLSRLPLPLAIFALAAGTFHPAAAGVEDLLHVRCVWKKVTDMKTLKTEPMSGTTDFFYEPISDLTGTMKKDGFDHLFVAGTRDNLIEGISHYDVDGTPAEQRVEINRYSGAIMNSVKTAATAQVLQGTCTRISGPDFGQDSGGQ